MANSFTAAATAAAIAAAIPFLKCQFQCVLINVERTRSMNALVGRRRRASADVEYVFARTMRIKLRWCCRCQHEILAKTSYDTEQ